MVDDAILIIKIIQNFSERVTVSNVVKVDKILNTFCLFIHNVKHVENLSEFSKINLSSKSFK